MLGSWSGDWITEEDMYPRVRDNYEDAEELVLFDYWEDYYREDERQD